MATSPLPSVTVPVINRRRQWTPEWYKFIRPWLEQTNDNTDNIASITTDVGSLSAAITAEAAARVSADSALATSISSVNAAYQAADVTINASITAEATARASADSALTTSINSVNAAYQAADVTINASIVSEASARAAADSALASDITTLTATVGTVSAAVTTETSARIAADGQIHTHFGVTLNVNDRVTGAIQLDGTGATSTFAVLADYFIIVHPTDNGDTIQAFIAGLVDGVATVGVNGDLIVDGTIRADSIVANSITADQIAAGSITAVELDVAVLSAITADIGEVTAGVIRSSDSKFVIDLDNKTLTITT